MTTESTKARAGYTLVELSVALFVGAIALAGGGMVLEHLGDVGQRLVTATSRDRARSEHEQRMRAKVRSVDASDIGSFNGTPARAEFKAWCGPAAPPLPDKCDISIAIVDRSIVAATGTRPFAEMTLIGEGAIFQYLESAAYGGTWRSTWQEALPPLAVRILSSRDTIMLWIGERG